jgi:DNA polymerase-3 subunit gamma/tau
MGQALYRKYRPTSFDQVINQAHIKTVLQNELAAKNVAHAYLFSGPRGVGKTTMARLLAKAVNAEVIAARQLNDASLLDIVEIDAASHTGVDNVRENIIQLAHVAPSQLPYKVFIIDEVHMLSASAFNALLKILEEPPTQVIFILATTEVHKVPATVISRCQRFDFHAVGMSDIVKRLQYICQQEHVIVAEDVLERVARKASGAFRDAESMLGQLLSLGEKHITTELADIVLPRINLAVAVELLDHLSQRQAQAYLGTIHNAVEAGTNLKELYQLLLELFRRTLLYSIDQSLEHVAAFDARESVHQQLLTIMSRLSTAESLKLLDIFMAVGQFFQSSPIPQLPLELAGVEWCQAASGHVVTAVTAAPTTLPIATAVQPAPAQPVAVVKSSPVKKIPVKQHATTNTNAQAVTQVVMAAAPVPVSVQQTLTPAPELLARVKQQWSTIITQTKTANHALAMALSVAHVANTFVPNIIQLGFRYDFHRNRVCSREHLQIIQTVLSEVLGQPVVLECIVGEQYDIDLSVLNTMPSDNIVAVDPSEVENIWDLALQSLGGKEVKS